MLVLGLIIINLTVITSAIDNKGDLSLSSLKQALAGEGEAGGGGKYMIVDEFLNTVTTYSSTTDGCIDGKKKNCMQITRDRIRTCMYGGTDYCTAGTTKITDKVCGNCK